VTYISKILRKCDFRAYCESFFPRTVMSENCSSWYNGGIRGGRIHGIWPGSGTHLNIVRREVRWEDWEYTYRNAQGNRFGYFGNGWSKKDVLEYEASLRGDHEAAEQVDFSPYLKKEAVEGTLDLRAYHEDWWEL